MMKKRILSVFCVLALCLGLLPVTALAAGEHGGHSDGWTALTADATTLSSGSYYLSDDVTCTGDTTITVTGEVTLCLNGHILDLNENFIEVSRDAKFTLCDCTNSTTQGYILNGLWEPGEIPPEDKDAEDCDLTGGVITGGANEFGGGIYVSGGTFSMSGGNIAGNIPVDNPDNTESPNGGGVYVEDGTFSMSGGSITGNGGSISCSGGGVYMAGGTFSMSGGKIAHNGRINTTGGGVYVAGGTFTMSGGFITQNSSILGGGVFAATGGTFIMSGGSITLNRNTAGGSGVAVGGGTFILSGGSITKNNSDRGNGGGVVVGDGTFTMSGGSITGNSANEAGGVYVLDGTFTMSGGSITGNSANEAGGVYVSDGTFILSDSPVIQNNTLSDEDDEDEGTEDENIEDVDTLPSEDDEDEEALPSNVYLSSGAVITIGAPLSERAQVSVTTQTPGRFTSGWNAQMGWADPANYFTADVSGNGIGQNTAGELALGKICTVTLDPNGGTLPDGVSTITSVEGAALPTPTRTGYTFAGWSETGNFLGAGVRDIPIGADGKILYAQWRDDSPSEYTITVVQAKNGTVKANTPQASRGETVTLTATADEGYELAALIVTDRQGKEVNLTHKDGNQYTFKMPSSRVRVEAFFTQIPPDSLPFTDVSENAWYADAVRYVYEHGLMAGTSATTFGPEVTTSRSMIATILWRMAGSPVVNYAMNYTDVDPAAWYGEAVCWAASQGVVTGYGDGTFGTDDPITREQFAVMLWQFAKNQGYDVSVGENTNILSYTDVSDLSQWAIPAMQWACGAGIISGTGNGSTLTPQGQATRAQAAVMLMQFCEAYMTW